MYPGPLNYSTAPNFTETSYMYGRTYRKERRESYQRWRKRHCNSKLQNSYGIGTHRLFYCVYVYIYFNPCRRQTRSLERDGYKRDHLTAQERKDKEAKVFK